MNASVRVELHELRPGDKPDYDLLHTSMNVERWDRYTFVGFTKKRLPTGVYRKTCATATMQDLMSGVLIAVNKTGHKAWIYLTRCAEELTWSMENDPVQPDELLRAARTVVPSIAALKPHQAPVSRYEPPVPGCLQLSGLE